MDAFCFLVAKLLYNYKCPSVRMSVIKLQILRLLIKIGVWFFFWRFIWPMRIYSINISFVYRSVRLHKTKMKNFQNTLKGFVIFFVVVDLGFLSFGSSFFQLLFQSIFLENLKELRYLWMLTSLLSYHYLSIFLTTIPDILITEKDTLPTILAYPTRTNSLQHRFNNIFRWIHQPH